MKITVSLSDPANLQLGDYKIVTFVANNTYDALVRLSALIANDWHISKIEEEEGRVCNFRCDRLLSMRQYELGGINHNDT